MQGRIYTVQFDNVATTVAVDLFNLAPAVDKPVRIIGCVVGQTNRVGDANEDMLRWAIIRMTGATYTAGSGGTTPTPAAVNFGDGAAGFTVRANDTTLASTTGTTTQCHSDCFNTRVGLQYFPIPEMQINGVLSTTGHLIVRLLEAPSASTTFSGTVYVEELG